MTGEERVYPLPDAADERFSFGLVLDVAKVFEQRGYPPVQTGGDLVALQAALYRFLHVGESE